MNSIVLPGLMNLANKECVEIEQVSSLKVNNFKIPRFRLLIFIHTQAHR